MDDDLIKSEFQNTFTISPCGFLIFTKSPHEDQIKCFRISNEECIGQFRIPLSFIAKKYTVTSLSYHPYKDLIMCTVFGLIHSCMFLLCDERNLTIKNGSDFEGHIRNLQECQTSQSQEVIKTNEINCILNRIDDLFFMAIRSSVGFMDMELLLGKLSIDSSIADPVNKFKTIAQNTNGERTNISSNVNSNESVESENGPRIFDEAKRTANYSSKSIDSQSNSSRYTYQIDKHTKSRRKFKQNYEYELNSQTDLSEQSNCTFEIQK